MAESVDFISSDRGRVRITDQMMMADNYFERAEQLQRIMREEYPHLKFWISEDRFDGGRWLSWEPEAGKGKADDDR